MRIKLKLKYRESRTHNEGRYAPRTGHSGRKGGLAALMENDKARDLHFMDCAMKGLIEQIPQGKLAYYAKRVIDFREEKLWIVMG